MIFHLSRTLPWVDAGVRNRKRLGHSEFDVGGNAGTLCAGVVVFGLMFLGRVGSLTDLAALNRRHPRSPSIALRRERFGSVDSRVHLSWLARAKKRVRVRMKCSFLSVAALEVRPVPLPEATPPGQFWMGWVRTCIASWAVFWRLISRVG